MESRSTSPRLESPPWLSIDSRGTVTLLVDRTEMGQGVVTALAMLAAEELEVDPASIRTEFAPADEAFANRWLGTQMTGGSTSVRSAWQPLREAAASARERLIEAAARRWDVPARECRAEQGTVVHDASGRRAAYGELAPAAADLPPPTGVRLKPMGSFRLLGRPFTGLDMADKIAGRTLFGVDVVVPGMLVAMVVRCPAPGGRPVEVDVEEVKRVPGIRAVMEIDSGIAVVADDQWSARVGRDRLKVRWEEGPLSALDSETISSRLRAAACREGEVARVRGNVSMALRKASRIFEAIYETPYLAHAPMETMNCTARVDASGCELWVPTQDQTGAQEAAMALTGLPRESVRVNTTYAGGGFGRRLEQDFVEQAVQVAQAMGAPVQVVWSLEDELTHDFYRPANCNRIRAALDAAGNPDAWDQCTAGPALAFGVDIPYRIPNLREEQTEYDPGVPTGAWRSVEASQNAFAVESFIDELAHAAGRDPWRYRHELLEGSPRHRAVLDAAAQSAGWGLPLPPGHGRGIAVYHSYGAWVAEVAEVVVGVDGAVRVLRVDCAVDCGAVVNPDAVEAQMEGGIVFGLTAALKGGITLRRGAVEQKDFVGYPLLTFGECPDIRVTIMESEQPPGGVGEPAVPPVAPAVGNAVFAATGRRMRRLPLAPRGWLVSVG